MKKSFIFTFVMAIVGAIIGAGFVSGKEVISFFGAFGYWALPFLLLVFALFFFCFYVFAKLGKSLKPNSISGLTTAMFGKAGIFVDFAFILSTFITLSSMLAGCDSIGQIMFGASYNFCYISIATAIIVTIIVFSGLKYIYKITDAILPVMLVLIFVVAFTFLFGTKAQNIVQTSINVTSAGLNSVLYVCMNTFSNIFIIAKTSQYMSKKQVGIACGISVATLVVLIFTILVVIFHGGDKIITSDMPMLAVAKSLGDVFGIMYAIVLWLAIFTTICVASYSIVQWLNIYIKNKFYCAVITLSLAFVFSRFGFSTIVDIFYPLEGIFGAIFIAYSAVYYFKNKNRFLSQELMQINYQKSAQSKELFDKSTYQFLNNSNDVTSLNSKDIVFQNSKNINSNNSEKNTSKCYVLHKNEQKTSKNVAKPNKNYQFSITDKVVSIKVDKLHAGIKKTKRYKSGKIIID